MDGDLLIANVRPLGAADTNLLVDGGRIESMAPGLSPPSPETTVIDGGGRLLFPGFVDAHAHMDKTLIGLGWYRNEVGPALLDKIENERRLRSERGIDPYQQSTRLARMAIAAGTTHIRTFVDIDTEWKLAGFEGVMRTRADFQDALTIQVVAFPQSGLLVRHGTLELMEEALRDGAEVAGVRLCAGNDGIRDAWGPLNMPDMLLRAFLIAYRNNLRRDDEIEMVLDVITHGGARVMGEPSYGLAPGCAADFVLVDGETHVEAVIERPPRWLVVKNGRVVARDGQCVI